MEYTLTGRNEGEERQIVARVQGVRVVLATGLIEGNVYEGPTLSTSEAQSLSEVLATMVRAIREAED